MEKKTFVPKRKAYLAPAAKSHLIEVEGSVMSPEWGELNAPGSIDDESEERTYGF